MKIFVNAEKKRTEIWLTRAESVDINVRESLKPVYQKYKEMKYLVVVFMSGRYDLAEQTALLFKNNLIRNNAS